MRRESKSTTGSVVKDRRSQLWQFFWWADGRRHSKTLGRFPTKKRGMGCSSSVPGPTASTATKGRDRGTHRGRTGDTV